MPYAEQLPAMLEVLPLMCWYHPGVMPSHQGRWGDALIFRQPLIFFALYTIEFVQNQSIPSDISMS